ncbi:MAG: GNAT family N-acetyltransferase [Verrucomicrobia bacterium]|nr:MAG: GNAT family N-acetyltransferase [Verrucomicrobiota bacterium]
MHGRISGAKFTSVSIKARKRCIPSNVGLAFSRIISDNRKPHLSMEYEIRPLLANDEPILREMLYQGLSSVGNHQPSREILLRPEFAHYADGWGRTGDTGFVAHDKKDGSVVGAVWLRKPVHKPDAPPELAFAVRPEHRRHGLGTALLTQLVRANPHESTISVSLVAGKPVLRLYERFGFKVAKEGPDAIVMQRHV